MSFKHAYSSAPALLNCTTTGVPASFRVATTAGKEQFHQNFRNICREKWLKLSQNAFFRPLASESKRAELRYRYAQENEYKYNTIKPEQNHLICFKTKT